MRYGRFNLTKSIIDNHNAEYAEGKHTYTLKLNHFADWVGTREGGHVIIAGLVLLLGSANPL